MASQAELVLAYRTLYPKSHISSIFRLAKNTSATKQLECVICGATGPSWCSRYPKTVTADKWEDKHLDKHVR